MGSITSNSGDIDRSGLLHLCQLPCTPNMKLYTQLLQYLLPLKDDPAIALLTPSNGQQNANLTIESLFTSAETEKSPEVKYKLITLSF